MRYLLLACLILSGCATTDTLPTAPITVKIPCKADEPIQPTYRYSPPYDDVFEAVRDLLGDRVVSQAYEKELRTALQSCK